jgi:hypothetical protein
MALANGTTRANVDALRKAAKILGVEAPKVRSAKADQELLGSIRIEVAKRLKTLSVDDHVKCGLCDEVATDDTPFCPFCGDEGSAEPSVEQAEATIDQESVGISHTPVPTAPNVELATQALERNLADRLMRIMELKRSTVGMTYEIGVECREIRDQKLYAARGYTSFKQFAEKELPFTRESAHQLIAIVEKHTKEDYEKIGYSKLRLIGAVSESEVKAELMEAARNGASGKELASKAGKTVAPAAPPKKPAPVPEAGEKITLLGTIGARAKMVKFHDADKGGEVIESAGTFKNHLPKVYGEIEIAGGVFVQIGLRISAEKELEGLTVRFVRAVDAAE